MTLYIIYYIMIISFNEIYWLGNISMDIMIMVNDYGDIIDIMIQQIYRCQQ